MSNIPDKWEADLREQVETHVFDYDPQAWAAMEELLDPAAQGEGTAADQRRPPSAANGGLTAIKLWIGFTLLLGLVFAGWLLKPKNALTPATLSSWPIQVVEDVVTTPPATAGLSSLPRRVEEPPRIVMPSAPPRVEVPKAAAATVAYGHFKALGDKVLLDLTAANFGVVGKLPAPTLPERLRSKSKEEEGLGLEPQLPPGTTGRKRKRDRRTLFPDVIENY